ncbi:MFS transporter [Actinocorallia sp. A-T 12471]|uniref:MFS transporter n=1 Tax=Actinocorallia sp. A-T 12471 TaxID=3089813 RepID=UPI0029D0EADA|nr:MFS transporter [Actinocorallia sp. A-T 12471]MDX6742667.1 MFS transporter [Actinocorallia sp. A-T 12471]
MGRVAWAYLGSYGLSVLGNSLAGVVMPLVVLGVTGSAWGAGVVAAVSVVPAVVAGVFMGGVVDRFDRRVVSVVTDVISGVSVAILPIVAWVGELGIGWFIVSALVGSLGDVPGMTAREALLPAVVRHGRMGAERVTGLRESLGAFALLVGPAAAGGLLAVFEAAAVLWITAGCSLAAAVVTLVIPRGVGAVGAEARRAGATRLREGWAVLVGSPFLLTVTGLGLAAVFVLGAFQALILPVYFLDRPGLLGSVLSLIALGMLMGGGLYAVLGTRGSRRVWLGCGLAGVTVGLALIGALASPGVVLAGAFLVGFASGLFNALLGLLVMERTPEAVRGRVTGTQNAFMTAVAPVSIIVAAALVEWTGLRTAAAAVTVVWLLAVGAALVARPLRTLEAEDGRAVAEAG